MTEFCKLCRKSTSVVGELRESHIIPKFMLRRSKDKKTGRSVLLKYGQAPKEGQFDWKERLFCAQCEFRFKFYEDFMNETFYLHRKHAVLSSNSLSITLFGNNNLMALGLLSIFWRAVESSLPQFQFMKLPEYMKETLREWILNRNMPINWEKLLIIRLSNLIDQNGHTVRCTITPRVRQLPTKFEFVFAFAGYFVEFVLPPNFEESFGKFALRRGSHCIRVKKVDYRLVPEISSMLKV